MFYLVFAAVDDEADAGDCDGGFGDVCGEDDFAGSGWRWEEDALLGSLGECGEEGKSEDLLFISLLSL